MKKKVLAILLSVLMLTSVTLPGTWATDDTEISTEETTVGDVVIEEPAPENASATDAAAVTEESATESATDTDTESATETESGDVTVVIVPDSEDESATDESESETAESEEESESVESEDKTEEFNPDAAIEYMYTLNSNEEIVAYLESLSEEELSAVQALLEEYGVWDLYADCVSDVVNALLACENTEAMEAMAAELTDEQKAALTDEQKTKLQERYDELHSAQGTALIYDTENLYSPRFTTVGPLVGMEDIWLPENWGVSAIANGDNEGELKLNKTATYENNAITITLEAFATGESITTYVKEGVDIVLMLDLSNYMKDSTGDKLTALKNAVKTFIGTVHDEAPSSRIAIVTYGDTASVVTGSGNEKDEALVTVDDTGYTTLTGIVDNLTIVGGSSNSHYAADDAVKIFQDVPTNSAEYQRQRIAVLFSAGIPGTGWTSNKDIYSGQSVGLATMVLAQVLKTDKGSTTVPTTDNFDGGFYWDKQDSTRTFKTQASSFYNGVSYDGCGATMYCVGLDIPTSGDAMKVSLKVEPYLSGARANEYFWRMSSHRLDGSHISKTGNTLTAYQNDVQAAFGEAGLTIFNGRYNETTYGSLYYFYPDAVTRNQTSGYYLTTESTSQSGLDQLTSIFGNIAGNASTVVRPSSSLNNSTVIKDIIAPQFQLPEGTEASNITIKTYRFSRYNGDFNDEGSWTENNGNKLGASATVTADGIVSVTGFDFSNNWCGNANSYTGQTEPHGNKLVISFVVSPKSGFLGGNDVYTNASAGVYENANATEPVLTFPRPTVNVPIQDVTVTAQDKNVYLLGDVKAADIKSGTTVKCGDVTLNLSKADDKVEPYGLEPWATEYVDITVTYTDKDGKTVENFKELKDDTTYTVAVTVEPKTPNPVSTQGTKAETKNNSATGNINVFKPELTYKDSEVHNGDDAPTKDKYDSENYVSTVWKHNDTLATDDTVTMTGTAPDLTFEYTPEEGQIVSGKINTTEDKIGVEVTVKIDATDVTGYAKFEHETCEIVTNCPALTGSYKFWLHILNTDLTITKIVDKLEPGQCFVFKVDLGDNNILEVVFDYDDFTNNTATKTIKDLKVGQPCTVTEITTWSWRYEVFGKATDTKTLVADKTKNAFTFTNKLTKTNWLDGNAYVDNTWKYGNGKWTLPTGNTFPTQNTRFMSVAQAVAYGFGKRYN